jgi:GTP-binding protein
VVTRVNGSIVSDRSGQSVAFALFNLEARGRLFIKPTEKVYHGMIVGEHSRESDLLVNPCKEKKLTNVRASGSDEAVTLTAIVPMTVERAIEFIKEDECVEITPLSIRPRKLVPPRK